MLVRANVSVMRFLENQWHGDDPYCVLERSLGRIGVRIVRIDGPHEACSRVGLQRPAWGYGASDCFVDREQIIEAFPNFCERVRGMGIEEVPTAPASPWQRPFVERLIGSIRRDCLDHVIIVGERHLRTILKSYLEYYHRSRTHLSLAKDTPEPRAIQRPEQGAVVELPEVGGLHHRYERRAA